MRLPKRPPTVGLEAFGGSFENLSDALIAINVATDPYRPWDRMYWRTPPAGLTREQWWVATRVQRRAQARSLPFTSTTGKAFSYSLPNDVLRPLQEISKRAGGRIGLDEPVMNPATRDRYLVSSLMEEAITSSQLEGATTTRRVAKEMLRSGRRPRTKSEQMIWNNFNAMEYVRQHASESITPERIRELHEIVTLNTLDDPADAGRIQQVGDERVYVESLEGDVVHEPPTADELPARLETLCRFANGGAGAADEWVPATVRAIIVHFMLGHDHYFVDGNGRLARAVFYWVMLREKLWLTEFVTISSILKAAPATYGKAYLYSEYEDDVTHFVIYQLEVLGRAFDQLEAYLAAQVSETRRTRDAVQNSGTFNHRQLAIIESALADPDVEYTVHSHGKSHRVSHETARQDLMNLEERGLLTRQRVGRQFVWRRSADFKRLLRGG